MTDVEYKEQNERVEKYNKCADRISVIEKKKALIKSGIIYIQCRFRAVDFDCL